MGKFQLLVPSCGKSLNGLRVDNDYLLIDRFLPSACNTIFVDRLDPNSRKNTTNRIKEVTGNSEYPPLLIFPEVGVS